MAADKKRISFIFEKSKSITTIPVSGAVGGESPDGNNVIAQFYIEYLTPPNVIESEYEEGKPINPNLGNQIKRGDITREIQTTIVMTPEQAINIGEWLIKNGKNLLKKRKNR